MKNRFLATILAYGLISACAQNDSASITEESLGETVDTAAPSDSSSASEPTIGDTAPTGDGSASDPIIGDTAPTGDGSTSDPLVERADFGGACEFTIDSNADWQQINDPDIQVFCVAPGNYSDAGVIQFSQSGSFSSPRYLKTIDTTHPAHQTPDMQAVVKYLRLHASHWNISGIVVRDSSYEAIRLESGASFNTLDSILVEQAHSAGLVARESSYNILQNSVMRNPVPRPGLDSYHMYMGAASDFFTVQNNELYNATGAWQQGPGSLGNHSILDNDMYMTPESYTDCNGNLDPSGDCSCGEMHIVLKGIDARDSAITIEGNRIWGMRRNDPLCMSSGSPGHGIDLGSGQNDTRNVVIKNNLIFDNYSYGIFLASVVSDVHIEGNLVYGNGTGLASGHGQNIATINNSFVANDNNINLYGTHWGTTEGNLEAMQMDTDVCFTIKQITNPQLICLN